MNQNRPTPAHLTSVQAEQILAQACENESHNAKRMRLGLDPVSQPMPVIPGVRGTNDLMLGLVMEWFSTVLCCISLSKRCMSYILYTMEH